MLKTSKLISLLLVVTMIFSAFSVGIVSASAEAPSGEISIVFNGETIKAHVDDTYKYTMYVDASALNGGVINAVDGRVYFDQTKFEIQNFDVRHPEQLCPNLGRATIQAPTTDEIRFNAVDAMIGYEFNSLESVMVTATVKITGTGETTFSGAIKDLGYVPMDGDVVYTIKNFEPIDEVQPEIIETFELVECGHDVTEPPTEPVVEPTEPVVEPTTAPSDDQLVVKIYDLEGNFSEERTFDIGDHFTVYTVLNAENIQGGYIGSLRGFQYYDEAKLEATDQVDDIKSDRSHVVL